MTDKEKCLLQREAFEAGYVVGCGFGAYVREDLRRREAAQEAKSRYPLPKVTRARVVRAKVGPFGFDWRLVKNTLEYANPEEEDWEPYKAERGEWADIAKILNDLLANPTEEITE